MKKLKVPIQGIKRSSPQGTVDGACDDLINMRFIKNAWRPLSPKVTLHPENTYDLQRIHTDDDIDNWIGYLESTKAIDYFNPATLAVTQAVIILNGTETLNDILFIKRTMIIITDENAYKFFVKDGLYVQINLTGIENDFAAEISIDESNVNIATEQGDKAEGLLSKYYKFLNEASESGYNYGGFFYRVALKMFDGNFIMHTSPKYYQFENHLTSIARDGDMYTLLFYTASINIAASYTQLIAEEFDTIKDFVQSIVVFGSKAEPLYDINEYTVTDTNLELIVDHGTFTYLKDQSIIGINPDFKDIGDSPAWYQIGEMPLNELDVDTDSQTDDILLSGASGSASITGTGGLSKTLTFNTSLSITALDFVNAYASDYLTQGVILKKVGDTLKFSKRDGTYVSPVITNVSGDLDGVVTTVVTSAIPGKYRGDIKVDMDYFYKNYATRMTLPVDDFSHYELTGNASYIYNDRLMLGDTKQKISLPNVEIPVILGTNLTIGTDIYNYKEEITGKVEIVLSTTNGDKIVTQDITYRVYDNAADPLDLAILLQSLVSYPDYRGKEIIFHIYDGADLKELFRTTLLKSSLHNFSYFINDKFDIRDDNYTPTDRKIDTNNNSYPITFQMASLSISTLLDEGRAINDANRWTISEVNNPMLFRNKNSNQVGTGSVIAFGTNTERIGTGQFGQFPIIIFTSMGRWIAEIGTGEIYITKIVPLDRDVIRDKDAKLDISFGIVYITSEGLKISQAKEVMEISEPVEGLPDLNFIDNDDFKYFVNNANVVQMIDYLDKVDFLTYLEGAVLGYNKNFENSELVIANPDYLYAYVYDIQSKTWYKFAEKIYQFIPSYPNLYAMSEKRTGIEAPYVLTKRILNISDEEAGNTQCMLITRALSMGVEDVFKKLHRTFIRGYFTTKEGTYAAAYIFGSDDLKNWQFVTGNDFNTGEFKDIWITHSKGSSRYFIIVFVAELSVNHQSIINRLNSIDSMYQEKRSNKLR